MPLRCWYSGNCLYFSNSSSHSSLVIGGRPPCGFHETIERPERVRRVAPPTAIIVPTRPAIPSSQKATGRFAATFSIVAVDAANFYSHAHKTNDALALQVRASSVIQKRSNDDKRVLLGSWSSTRMAASMGRGLRCGAMQVAARWTAPTWMAPRSLASRGSGSGSHWSLPDQPVALGFQNGRLRLDIHTHSSMQT